MPILTAHRRLAVCAWLAGLATAARADFIKPVTAWASSTYNADQIIVKIVNGVGLSGSESVSATHDNQASAQTMWHAAAVAASNVSVIVLLDTDTAYDLTQMYVWNHNQAALTGRGISNVNVYVSADAHVESPHWEFVGTCTFARAAGGPTEPCQSLPLPATRVRMVKLSIQSAWDGAAAPYVGLSEIRFEGTPVPVSPMPWTVSGYTAYNTSYAHRNAVTGTEADYASQGGGTNTYLDFDFVEPVTFDRIVMVQRDSPAAADLFQRVRITCSADAVFDAADPYEELLVSQPLRGRSDIVALTRTAPARYVRWKVESLAAEGTSNVGAMEILFLRQPPGSARIAGVTVVYAATPFNADYAAVNAVNGVVGRSTVLPAGIEYAAAGLGVDTFLDFDLGRPERLAAFEFIDRLGYVDHVDGFDLILSQDATFGNGDDVKRSYATAGSLMHADHFPSSILCRYVRFDVTSLISTSPNAGASEFIFYRQTTSGTVLIVR